MTELRKHSAENTKPQPMEVALEKLLTNDDLYVFGHGTGAESNAAATMQEGLHLRTANLWSTVAGLSDKTEGSEQLDAAKKKIEAWPHRESGYVVAVGVERLPDEKVPHRRYLQSIVQHRPNTEGIDDRYGEPYTISPRFIAGYFDAGAKTFIPNPNFDPTYNPSLLETTADDEINREKDAVPILEWMGAATVGESTGISTVEFVDLDAGSDYIPMVW